jgi:hypothetical protein
MDEEFKKQRARTVRELAEKVIVGCRQVVVLTHQLLRWSVRAPAPE